MKIEVLGVGTKDSLNERIQTVSAAASLSRAKGTVTDIYNSRKNYDKNLDLIKRVLGYGHKTIGEHDYIVLALENCTPIIEQILISYRLTSFTIKSRREVDFRNVGFYVPDFKDKENNILNNNDELKEIYKKYMYDLFERYGKFVDMGIPKEDCRYILPYSYYSNMIMGCDANEILLIASDMLYGDISKITEVHNFGLRLKEIIDENIPYLSDAIKEEEGKSYYKDKFSKIHELVSQHYKEENTKLLSDVNIIDYTKNPDLNIICSFLMSNYQLSYSQSRDLLYLLSKENYEIKREIMQSLLNSKSHREFEQVKFSFEIPISLAALTHITRHRMQSLMVPNFIPLWNFENYITPNTFVNENLIEYENIFKKNIEMLNYFRQYGVRDEDLIYFYLSGNACNIYTTVNGRAFERITRMRSCGKSQWEIRNIVNKMIDEVKEISPLFSNCLGPSCKVYGLCPEGKDSCKNRRNVKKLEIKPINK